MTDRSRNATLRWGPMILCGAVLLFAVSGSANPVPTQVCREMNDRPARWLHERLPEDERDLVRQFGQYGVAPSLLQRGTVALLERQFDLFAPLIVQAQSPPAYAPDRRLQEWYRAHANREQATAMLTALRHWVDAPVTQAPPRGSLTVADPPEAVVAEIRADRLSAIELLGDWRDRRSLEFLRKLRTRRDLAGAVLETSIRRIEDPTFTGTLAIAPSGVVTLRRSRPELSSLEVAYFVGTDRSHQRTWTANAKAMDQIFLALANGTAVDLEHPTFSRTPRVVQPNEVRLEFRDGEVLTLRRVSSGWDFQSNGHSGGGEFADAALDRALLHELAKIDTAAGEVRFLDEAVVLTLTAHDLHVNGLYRFDGVPADGWAKIRYPIARGSGLGAPRIESVELLRSGSSHGMPVTLIQRGYDCDLAFRPGDVESYQLKILYRQPVTKRIAKYLITTALAWKRPLDRGWFLVIADSSLARLHFNMPFHEETSFDGKHRFTFESSPFKPDRDLIVSW